jgi:hypothetical protein
MKNKKWLNYTLGILFSLIALAAVGMAGFRVGMMQTVPFGRVAFDHNFGNNGQMMQGVNPTDGTNNTVPNNNANGGNFEGDPRFMQGNMRGQEFNKRGFDRRDGMSVFGGLFGLIHFAILALLLWFGYKFVKNSGWKLVRVQNTSTAAEPISAAVEDKKE